MKLRISSLILAVLFTVFSIGSLIATNIGRIRWDKIPVIKDFVLEVELASAGFDASYLEEPITWEQLDEEPLDWEEKGSGSWFYLNTYTKKLLKEYMRENNLGIVPDKWSDFKFRSDFEECLKTFEFVELGEPCEDNSQKDLVGNILGLFFGCLAVAFWVVFIGFSRKTGDGSVC